MCRPSPGRKSPGPPRPSSRRLRCCSAAARPLIVAGGGAVASGAFAEVSGAGRGAARTGADLDVGPRHHAGRPPAVGGRARRAPQSAVEATAASADVLLGLGTRFEEMETNWRPGYVPHRTRATSRSTWTRPSSAAVHHGATSVSSVTCARSLGQLLECCIRPRAGRAVDEDPRVREVIEGVAEIDAAADEALADDRVPLTPLRVIRSARGVFPRATTVATDVGCLSEHIAGCVPVTSGCTSRGRSSPRPASTAWASPHPPRRSRRSCTRTGPRCASAATARSRWCCRCCRPPRRTTSRSPGACSTTRRSAPSATCRSSGCTSGIWPRPSSYQPDFAAVAAACGCYGETVTSPEAIEPALRRALAANVAGQPAVLDFRVAPDRMEQSREHFNLYPAPSSSAGAS